MTLERLYDRYIASIQDGQKYFFWYSDREYNHHKLPIINSKGELSASGSLQNAL